MRTAAVFAAGSCALVVAGACVTYEPASEPSDDAGTGPDASSGGPASDGTADGESIEAGVAWDASHCNGRAFCDSFDDDRLRPPWTAALAAAPDTAAFFVTAPRSLRVAAPKGGSAHYMKSFAGAKGAIVDVDVKPAFAGWSANGGFSYVVSVVSSSGPERIVSGIFASDKVGLFATVCARSPCGVVATLDDTRRPADEWKHARFEVRFGSAGYFDAAYGDAAAQRRAVATPVPTTVSVYVGVSSAYADALTVRYDNAFVDPIY